MRFILYEDKIVKNAEQQLVTWVEAGEYEIVRLFDNNRIVIKVGSKITLAQLNDGEIV